MCTLRVTSEANTKFGEVWAELAHKAQAGKHRVEWFGKGFRYKHTHAHTQGEILGTFKFVKRVRRLLLFFFRQQTA